MSNWILMKQNKEERVISVNEEIIDCYFNWFYHYESISAFVPDSMISTRKILEDAPNFNKKIDFVILKKHLKNIEIWYKNYSNKNKVDEESFSIIDEALNPKEPKGIK